MKMSVKDIRNNLADAINRVAYAASTLFSLAKAKASRPSSRWRKWPRSNDLRMNMICSRKRKARKEKGGVSLDEIKKRLNMK